MDDVLSQFTANKPTPKPAFNNFYNKRSQTADNFFPRANTFNPMDKPRQLDLFDQPITKNPPKKTDFYSKPRLQLSKTVNFQDLRKEQQRGDVLMNTLGFSRKANQESANVFGVNQRDDKNNAYDLLDLLIDDDKTFTKGIIYL